MLSIIIAMIFGSMHINKFGAIWIIVGLIYFFFWVSIINDVTEILYDIDTVIKEELYFGYYLAAAHKIRLEFELIARELADRFEPIAKVYVDKNNGEFDPNKYFNNAQNTHIRDSSELELERDDWKRKFRNMNNRMAFWEVLIISVGTFLTAYGEKMIFFRI